MEWGSIPEWLKAVMAASLGALGTLGLGMIRAWTDNKRIRADDRDSFTQQVMDRLSTVEQQLQDERAESEVKLERLQQSYEQRLKARDEIITDLRARLERLEQR